LIKSRYVKSVISLFYRLENIRGRRKIQEEESMNRYTENLSRIEFVVTRACTGHCKHCSEGEHSGSDEHLEAEAAAGAVYDVAENYHITSLMTFGGEPLIYPEIVYAIHTAATDMKIQKRQIITNGFFSKDSARIKSVAENLVQSGVNEIMISADAFHQETIPLEPVKEFAEAVNQPGISVKVHPAWLVEREHKNPYNLRTLEILKEFEDMGIAESEGNIIFPRGNALKYLGDYFDKSVEYTNPYEEDPEDIHAICIDSQGDVLGGNIYQRSVMEILDNYVPQ